MKLTQRTKSIARSTGLFVAFSIAWIVLSDKIVGLLANPNNFQRIEIIKGIAYVILAAVLYALGMRQESKREESQMESYFRERTALLQQLQVKNFQLNQAYDDTVESLVRALEMRENGSGEHSRRLVRAMNLMSSLYNLENEDREYARRGALLHDIGKIAVPDNILLKPASLSEEERAVINSHPLFAKEWLSNISYLQNSLDIPIFHHERWNGSGYPFGLAGEKIPLTARIFAVLDVVDAMSFDRPYRKAMPKTEVLDFLKQNAGILFDPTVVDTFVANDVIDILN